MNKVLRTAKAYEIDYCPLEITGFGIQNALACIFEIFGVQISKDNIFVDEYEVERKQLCDLHESIFKQDVRFQNHMNELQAELSLAEIDCEKFLQILDDLINRSDQRNPKVLISWLDKEKKPKNLSYVMTFYTYSDVCLGETLLSIPADGLTIQEAFMLYIESMQWGENDRFIQIMDEEVIEL